ncbi:MAG: bifunctional DNA primase/polymerase [Patescibacteria group bacterium]|nr:bifunctional DNA primase/polymerase [Patescibacteria group bacterium]
MTQDPQSSNTGLASKAAVVDQYRAAGFIPFPLNGKVPALTGNWRLVKTGKFSSAELAGRNYALIIPDDAIVIDVDPRNFAPKDDKPFSRLKTLVGDPLETLMVRSGRGDGGAHFYFRVPKGFKTAGKLAGFPGIDVKAHGGFVVGPGSIHPETGGEYKIEKGSPSEIKDAPEALLNLLRREEKDVWNDVGTGKYIDDAANRARYVDYLTSTAPPSGSYGVACSGRDLGLPPAVTWELMVEYWNPRRAVARPSEHLKDRVINAYRFARGAVGNSHPSVDFGPIGAPAAPPKKSKTPPFKTGVNGAAAKCYANLLHYLQLPSTPISDIFGFNLFTEQVEFTNPAPWHEGRMPAYPALQDSDLIMLKTWLVTSYSFEMPTPLITEAVVATAQLRKFHPVREYLDGLKWDGTARLDFWLRDFLGVADSLYTQACARKVLCAAVMRIFRPGCKFDHVLVLEGAQRIGKSTVCGILGGAWFLDSPIDPQNKDTVQLMQGKWVIELAEMEVTRRAEADALKAFLTRQTDKVRMAYGRLAGEYPRQSIFIASKNPEADGAYLKDSTGNRRWWPVSCSPKGGQVDFKAFRDVRNQLWAEAVHRVKTVGEPLYMETEELRKQAQETVSLRHAEDAWTERVGEWLQLEKRGFLTARDIYCDALGGLDKQLDRRVSLRIAGVMKTHGWESVVQWTEGRPKRGYVKKQSAYAEIVGL